MIDRKITPALGKVSEIKLNEPEKIVLKNGVPLYVINAGEQDVVKIEVIFKAGAREDQNFLIAGATNELLDEGTAHHSSAEIAGMLEFYGAVLHTDCSADWATASLFTINKFLENVFPLFHEIIAEPVFPEKEIETFQVQNKQRLQVNNNKVDYAARKTFNQKLFGQNSVYGYYQAEKDYHSLDKNTLKAFHERNYLDGVFAIIVAGKVNDNTIKLISKFFDDSQNAPISNILKTSANLLDSQNFNNGEKYYEQKKEAVQSGIRIGKKVFNRLHPDYKGLSVLNTVLGGYFGSRLMSNIREDKGYTYGVGSGLVSLMEGGYFFIATEVGTTVRDAALKEIYFEIERLRKDLVSEEELRLVKNYLIGSFQRSIDGPFALADRLKSILTYGLGYEYFSDYINTVNTISSKKLLNLAQEYLDPQLMTEVIIG